MVEPNSGQERAASALKYSPPRAFSWLGVLGNAFAVAGMVILPLFSFIVGIDLGGTVVALSLSFFSLAVLAYSIKNLRDGRLRYVNAMYYFHCVNHTMRDYMAKIINGDETRPLEDELRDIVTAIASCFSVVTGQKCRCCIKALETNRSTQSLYLRTVARDELSVIPRTHNESVRHKLDENTDFSNLWYAVPPCFQGYIANDIPTLFIRDQYQNTSIEKSYKPDISFGKIRNWPLSYVSTMVVPIRYVAKFSPPRKGGEKTPDWIFWGFLCIDSNRKNVFLDAALLELACGFADSIYSFISNVEHNLKKDLFSR